MPMSSTAPCYQDHCSVELSAQACDDCDASNLAVLAAINALEAQPPPHVQEDTEGRLQEWQYIDAKLNVLIQMFAGFWRQQCDLPTPVRIELSASGLCLPATLPRPASPARSVRLYLHPALPQALQLPVGRLHADPEAPGMLRLEFGEIADEVDDALSRHVFRHHRRALAQARQASNLHSGPE